MVRVIVLGCGHWGKNYVRLFSEILGADRVVAVDTSEAALASARGRHPGLITFPKVADVPPCPGKTVAVVATPAAAHDAVIRQCIDAGWDVLAEKPLTLNASQADRLVREAARAGRILMVGHTFLYNPAVRKMHDLIRRGTCGTIYYMKAVRTHLGLVRKDVNAVWDLAPHDVAIFNYLTGGLPLSVSAIGGTFLTRGREDVAFINLRYPAGVAANIHVSWADSNKERTITVVGSRARIVFDDLNALERVKIFEKGISANVAGGDTFGEFLFALRDGDIISPKVPVIEPLAEVCKEFLRCVRTRREPFTSGRDGANVVRIMCAIEESLKRNGRQVAIRA